MLWSSSVCTVSMTLTGPHTIVILTSLLLKDGWIHAVNKSALHFCPLVCTHMKVQISHSHDSFHFIFPHVKLFLKEKVVYLLFVSVRASYLFILSHVFIFAYITYIICSFLLFPAYLFIHYLFLLLVDYSFFRNCFILVRVEVNG